MILDFNDAPRQKEYELEPGREYTAREVAAMTGVALKRIYDLVDSGILQPSDIIKKGDEVRNFTYYDATNVFEVYLVNRLTAFNFPKRMIKDFFNVVQGNRKILDPFKISNFKGVAFLCFYCDPDDNDNIAFSFFDKKRSLDQFLEDNPPCYLVNLKSLSKRLFERVDSID